MDVIPSLVWVLERETTTFLRWNADQCGLPLGALPRSLEVAFYLFPPKHVLNCVWLGHEGPPICADDSEVVLLQMFVEPGRCPDKHLLEDGVLDHTVGQMGIAQWWNELCCCRQMLPPAGNLAISASDPVPVS